MPDGINVAIGQDFQILCDITQNPQFTRPQWSDPDNQVIGDRGVRIFTRAETEFSTRLYIRQLQTSDAGTYTCQVGGQTTTFTLRLGGKFSSVLES